MSNETQPEFEPAPTPAPPVPKCGAVGLKRRFIFVYKPDITTAELAAAQEIIMFGFATMVMQQNPQAAMMQRQLVDQMFDALSEESKRHWEVSDLPVGPPASLQGVVPVTDPGAIAALEADMRRLREQQAMRNQGRPGRNGGGRHGGRFKR